MSDQEARKRVFCVVLCCFSSLTQPRLIALQNNVSRNATSFSQGWLWFMYLFLFFSQQPSTCPTCQRLPAGPSGGVSPPAPHPAPGQWPWQSGRAAHLQLGSGGEQRRASPVRGGGRRWRNGGSGTELWWHLQLDGAKRGPGPLQAPAQQSQVSAGVPSIVAIQIFRFGVNIQRY